MVDIDRIAPTHRPQGKAAGFQRWRELLFVHWAVPEAVVRPLVPPEMTLDLHDGVLYVGLVPFIMEGVRPWWAPEAVAFNFLETNLRTYVHVNGEPGVFFFSLEAASWIAVQTARIGWKLPYHHATMERARQGDVVRYQTVRKGQPKAQLKVEYRLGEMLGASTPGTLEHFLLERYLLFTRRGKEILRGQVYHTPYPAQRAELISLEEGLVQAAGMPAPEGPPPLVHFASGVDVEVFALAPV